MKKLKSMVLSIFFIFTFVSSSVPCFIALEKDTITIYHTNDMHGRVQSTYRTDGSFSKIGCDVLKNVKAQTPNSLLVDAGDPTQGLTFANYSKGEYVIKMMNAAGYDAMAVGNHEFDYGLSMLEKNVQAANFPVLAANAVRKDTGEPFLQGINGHNGCNVIKDVNGKKIGFFGITTEESSYKTNPNNVKDLEFKSAIETSKEQVSLLESQGADVIVGIMHVGVDESSSPTSRDIARSVEGIDAIIDGHSHTKVNEYVNDTFIGQTGTASDYLGKIEITFEENGAFAIAGSLVSAADIGKQYAPDPETTKLYDSLFEELKPSLQKVVGKLQNTLYGGSYQGKSIARMGETNLGSFMADAMRWESKNLLSETGGENENIDVVAMLNGGAVRASLDAGYIRQEDITQTLPSGTLLSLKRVTPHTLYQALENSVSKLLLPQNYGETLRGEDGRFPQVSGMRVEFDANKTAYDQEDPAKGEGERVIKVVLLNEDGTDKKVLDRNDDETPLALASTDFATAGGDGFTMLKGLPTIAEGQVMDDIVSNYIRKLTVENDGSFSYPLMQNRVVLLNFGEIYGSFDATVTVKQASSALALKTVSVQIDSQPAEEIMTSENGEIILKDLPAGAHDIRLTFNDLQGSCFIDNSRELTSVQVTLEPNLEDVDCTINLISQIPADMQSIDEGTVKFARNSYDSLSREQQEQVSNYETLLQAEKVLSGQASSNVSNPLTLASSHYVPVVLNFVFLGAVFAVVWVFVKKQKHSE